MNTGYAISDFVLALSCIFIGVRAPRARAGVALACAALAAAAVLGVLRFSVVPEISGPHKFFSLIGGTAALPLLAASVAWPDSKSAKTGRGAAVALLVGSGIGIALIAGAVFPLWGQAAPAASALVLLGGALRLRNGWAIAGAAVLVITFAEVAAGVTLAGYAPTEILHYGMAAALLLLYLAIK
jgi:hypothetical protein